MQKKLGSLFAVLLGAVMILTSVIPVLGMDPAGAVPDYVLDYIYIDSPSVYQNESQTIGVEIEQVDADHDNISDIRLGYTIQGINREVSYKDRQDDLVLFEIPADKVGTYSVRYVDIVRNKGRIRLSFTDEDIAITDAEYDVIDNPLYSTEDTEVKDIVEYDPASGNEIQIDVDQMRPVGADGKVIVVLDPGHDSLHPGAAGNGLHEEVLTLKIAQYCKEELEKYNNITVYMTRNDGSCLNTSSNGECLKARSLYAASLNANILVSIHVDAGSATASGPMVIVAKKGNYRDDLANVTHDIGNKILDELTKLGLASRGLYVRMSDSPGEEYVYPNGAVADYYSITRNCIRNGIPGIIVEHCFISNPSDAANYLSSDEKLKALGVADATGIAKYYGLSKRTGSKVGEALYNDSRKPYVSEGGTNVSDFIALLYERALGRTPKQMEVSYWIQRIEVEQLTGSTLTRRFVNSEEFIGLDYSDEEFIERLYEVYLGRGSDKKGKAHWLDVLHSGSTRLQVADRIGNSPEFEEICAKYGMAQGSHKLQYSKLYPALQDYITPYYNGLLNRNPDPSGMEHWCEFLVKGGTAAELSRRFINSPEFRSKDVSKEDFVEGLYQTYLRRASDPSGKEHWMEMLPTMSYDEQVTVIRGFVRSKEYHDYCDKFGVEVGTL